jgi:hypothetical protein
MENKNEVTVIDPKDYGLERENVVSIEQAFAPKIAEREALVEVYKLVLSKEMTPELADEAKELRLKLVKVRTGIASIHQSQKAFALAFGRFVDAWKNKETLPVTQMEEELKKIEDHYEKIERDRLDALQKERVEILSQYLDGANERELCNMDEDVWLAFLDTKKKAHEERLKQEQEEQLKREEEKRKQAEENERIRVENEKLKKEAEEKKIIHEKRSKEMQPYIVLIRDYNGMINMSEEDYQKLLADIKRGEEERIAFEKELRDKRIAEMEVRERIIINFLIENGYKESEGGYWDGSGFIGSNHYSFLECDEDKDKMIQHIAKDVELRAEREQRQKAEEELQRKEREELDKKERAEKLAQQELEKGDAARKRDLVAQLDALVTRFSVSPFKSKVNQAKFETVKKYLSDAAEVLR